MDPLWFNAEDFSDADYSMLSPLLKESFNQWMKEAHGLSLFQTGQFILYDTESQMIASTGQAGESYSDKGSVYFNTLISNVIKKSSVLMEEWGDRYAIAVPLYRRKERAVFAVLVYTASALDCPTSAVIETSALHFRSCFYRLFEQLFYRDLDNLLWSTKSDLRRMEILFQAAKQLYAQTDASAVLIELLSSLEELYPESDIQIYLSQDHLNGDPRVKPLIFKNSENSFIAKVFLSGVASTKSEDGTIQIAVPMNGKQAVYGVICMSIMKENWKDARLGAFQELAQTSGLAFEMAKINEQSNLLIDELRLINEVTKRLNKSLRLNEIFQFACSELLKIFEADYCCVLQLNKIENQFVVMASNSPAWLEDRVSIDYGFCGMVYKTKEPLIVSDYWHNQTINSKLMDYSNSRSLIAAPIVVDSEVLGVILVTNKAPNFFTYENYKLLQVMGTHIGLAITNASLHAEVRRMVITDNLTGLYARHYLDEQINSRQKKDRNGSLILIDIDQFKKVNDTFGHQVGDKILIQVSKLINASIRQGDIAARWGGEELAIYLPNIRVSQALRIAERIRACVMSETDPKVTISCGVSEWSDDDEKVSVETLFYRADMALYEAKNNGRNRIFVGE